MAVVIRMTRHGMKKKPFYRVVAADKDFPRDGRYLEVLGTYDPRISGGKADLNAERIEYWVSKGARPSVSVSHLMKRTFKKAS